MMPDDRDAANARHEERITQIVARCGNIFTRFQLSPPAALTRSAVRHWLGLTPDEIAEVLYEHMDRHRCGYTQGSGDQLFHVLQADISKAIAAKHPVTEPEPDRERPQRLRRRVVTLPTAGGGLPDLYLEGAAAGPVIEPSSNVDGPSGLPPGYDAGGTPIAEDEP
jgi:hypothetical protein